MNTGRVFGWERDQAHPLGGRIVLATESLVRLDATARAGDGLTGRFVTVRNGGALRRLDPNTNQLRETPIGNARPDANGNYLFEPGRGGGRMDKADAVAEDFEWRYVQAAHFGEVNTYFHLDRMAAYVDELRTELELPSLPPVTAIVNAHHGVTERDGVRDGVRRRGQWVAFQGGHYRLSTRNCDVCERHPVSPLGEIHLGPGRQLVHHGALTEFAGGRYRANASHNAGILYHEYGHHLTRHTADFRANATRRPDRQSNRKTAIDEGTCDYWAAAMLGTPHIWAWHCRHDEVEVHPRSLSSGKTMADYRRGPGSNPHANGTIWAAALWDVRCCLGTMLPRGERDADRLLIEALHLIGTMPKNEHALPRRMIRRARSDFAAGLSALLQADDLLFAGRHGPMISACFEVRGLSVAAARSVA